MLTRRWWLWTAPLWIAAILAGALWGSFSIPAAYKQECYENKKTHQKDCALYHISLIALREVREALSEWEPVFVGLGTLAIAAFTCTLWITTKRLWKAGDDQIAVAKDAAKAARDTANVAIGVELPRFVVTAISFERPHSRLQEDLHDGGVEVALTNLGRTDAAIVRSCINIRVCGELPPQPRYRNVANIDFGKVVSPQEIYRFGKGPLMISEEESEQISRSHSFLWVYGFVSYNTFLDVTYRKGFVAVLNVHEYGHPIGFRCRFIQRGPEAYTYTKPE